MTVEPGGQIELSGSPAPDILAAVTDMRRDVTSARLALAPLGLGLAHVGADPLRPPRRVNPRPRYRAMEQHFAATGKAAAGVVMMNSTAALQVNLQAGPRTGWSERIARAHRLGPTLLALSASSPWLSGRDTGWKSARQRAWAGLDPAPAVPCLATSRGPASPTPRPPGLTTRCARQWPSSGPALTTSRPLADLSRSSSGRQARSGSAAACRPRRTLTST